MDKLKVVYKKLADITPYENNPRKNDEAVQFVKNSIEQFGFKNPIIIDSAGVIVAGHTRFKAAQELELKEVPTISAEDLTPEQVKAYRLADNKVAEFSTWDDGLLELELDELEELPDIDMADFGFERLEIPNNKDDVDTDDLSGILQRKFIVPPFSVFDARQGYWLNRKRAWRELIGDEGQARDNVKPITFDDECGADASILDPVLSEVICTWFTPPGCSSCFDVFAGDTVFGYVCSHMGHMFTGIELRQEQVDYNNNRTDNNAVYICDDGRNVLQHIAPQTQDLLFSCPPYFDLEIYSDMENDASNQDTYADFYSIIDTAFSNALQCLKENRFAFVVAGDVRNKKTGEYYRLPDDIKNTFCGNGMKLYNEIILIDPIGTAAYRAGKYMDYRKVAKIHQNVLVFYKGDTKEIKKYFPRIEANYESDDME